MSTPNPHTISDAHWHKIERFVRQKADEDGKVEPGELFDIMRQYWKLLNDETALTAATDDRELVVLKERQAKQEDALQETKDEIARREGRTPPSPVTP